MIHGNSRSKFLTKLYFSSYYYFSYCNREKEGKRSFQMVISKEILLCLVKVKLFHFILSHVSNWLLCSTLRIIKINTCHFSCRLNKVRKHLSASVIDPHHESCWIRGVVGTLDETVKYLRFQTDTHGTFIILCTYTREVMTLFLILVKVFYHFTWLNYQNKQTKNSGK